jgi:peptidoglycan-associated lipoprotein
MKVTRILTVTALSAMLAACATNDKVEKSVAASQAETNKKFESVASQIEDLQTKQKATDSHLAATDQKVSELSQEAQDALKRAQEAGVLSKGKVVFQQTFSEDRVKFKTASYDLNDEARTALDEFGGKVKGLNEQYFIEIQGHTDDVGGRKYNDDLGQRRADEVRRYLSRKDGLALNRMSTISYGDTLPTAPNKTKKGRAENRRVVIVVLE